MAELSRLPGPVADLYEWQYQGACRDDDASLFFHPESERGPARRNRDAAAVAICASCPVMDACRSFALKVREPYGVWGGLTEDDRTAIYLQERKQGRAERVTDLPARTVEAVEVTTVEMPETRSFAQLAS